MGFEPVQAIECVPRQTRLQCETCLEKKWKQSPALGTVAVERVSHCLHLLLRTIPQLFYRTLLGTEERDLFSFPTMVCTGVVILIQASQYETVVQPSGQKAVICGPNNSSQRFSLNYQSGLSLTDDATAFFRRSFYLVVVFQAHRKSVLPPRL